MRRWSIPAAVIAAACATVPAASPPAGEAPARAPSATAGVPAGRLAGAEEPARPITRPLDAYLGRAIWISAGGAPPEQWVLREIGSDHLTIERSRTYRVVALHRVWEITWTDLTGADPTPRVVLAPQ